MFLIVISGCVVRNQKQFLMWVHPSQQPRIQSPLPQDREETEGKVRRLRDQDKVSLVSEACKQSKAK